MNTAWRKLHHNLVLVTRQQLGKTADWGLPVIEVTEEDTLRSVSVASHPLIVKPFPSFFDLIVCPLRLQRGWRNQYSPRRPDVRSLETLLSECINTFIGLGTEKSKEYR